LCLLQRKAVSEQLEDLLDALLATGAVLGRAQIIEARVPIIKCCLGVGPGGRGLDVDVCLGAANGAAAVGFVRAQVLAVPPLRPLALVVKALLRDRGMGEVFTGGVGSYAVTNMVLAHLQAEGFEAELPPPPPPPAAASRGGGGGGGKGGAKKGGKRKRGEPEPAPAREAPSLIGESAAAAAAGGTFEFLHWLATGGQQQRRREQQAPPAPPGGGPSQPPPQQRRQPDLGHLLWGFLERFGSGFDYGKQAVSIRKGGVAKKGPWRQPKRPWLLAVEDPQEPGKDIGSGSFNIREVRDVFASAGQQLAAACEDADGGGAPAGDGRTGLLAGVLDVGAAVGRGGAAVKARRALEQRAVAARAAVARRRRALAPALARRGGRELGAQRGRGAGAGPSGGRGPPPAEEAARGGRSRGGSKAGRQVAAQWGPGHRKGQFFE
jgi:hypothetical protein